MDTSDDVLRLMNATLRAIAEARGGRMRGINATEMSTASTAVLAWNYTNPDAEDEIQTFMGLDW